jgi:peptidoglycan/xylan/chitin deacetylase (PgdA/CDA1 family)
VSIGNIALMKKLKTLIKGCLFYSGLLSMITLLFPNKRVAILRYHSVKNGKENFYSVPGVNISIQTFERHVRYFSKNYRIVSLDEVVKCIKDKIPFKKNSVVFTFDDGYKDNYDAFKILKKYGGQGTVYLTAGCIEGKTHLWLFVVRYLIMNTHEEKVKLIVNGKPLTFCTKNKEKAISDITILIKSNDIQTREDIMKQLRRQLVVDNLDEASKNVMLTWNQVRKMFADGMTMGGHTSTHCNLPNAKPEEARKEIEDSKRLVDSNLKTNVKHFAYPNSGPYPYFNNEIKAFVKDAGFCSATTSLNGFVDMDSDLFELKRIRTTEIISETVCSLELERFKEKN